MSMRKDEFTAVEVLEDRDGLTPGQLSLSFRLSAEELRELVDEGVIEPLAERGGQPRFAAASLRRIRCALRLRRDLGVNWAGAALALELIEEVERLRARLLRYENPRAL